MTQKRKLSKFSENLSQTAKMLEAIKLFEQSSKSISISKYSGVYDVKEEKVYPKLSDVKVKINDKEMERLLASSNQKSPNNEVKTVQNKPEEVESQKKKSHLAKCSKSKSEIKKFLSANKKRGLSRKEIMEFLDVSRMSIVEEIFAENKMTAKLNNILVDLRKCKLEGEPIIPGKNDKKIVDNSKVTNNLNDISDTSNKDTNNLNDVSDSSNKDTNNLNDVSDSSNKVTNNLDDISDSSNKEPNNDLIGTQTNIDRQDIKPNNSSDSSITSNSEESAINVSNKSEASNDKAVSDNTKNSQNKQEISGKLKKVTTFSRLFENNMKIHNYIMDLSIMKMSTEDFIKFLDYLLYSNPKEIPVFWLYRSDFEYYDNHKNTSDLARNLIKFFSQDEDRVFSRLINEIRPERKELAEICSKNKITLISGNSKNIIESKLNNVDVIIPGFFKEKFPNPLIGNKVYGFDSSAAIHLPNDRLVGILGTCKRVIISDIQYKEMLHGGEDFLKIIAYYGEIYKVMNYKESDLPDSKIIKFYKQYPVDMVYTCDSGFKLNSEFNGVPCSLIEISRSAILQKLNKSIKLNCNFFEDGDTLEESYVKFDCFNKGYNGKIHGFTNRNKWKFSVTVFDSQNKKRIPVGNTISTSNGDVLCIRSKDAVLISIMTDCKNFIAKVWYFGEERKVPNRYRCYLI